jgi:hypothetical protein
MGLTNFPAAPSAQNPVPPSAETARQSNTFGLTAIPTEILTRILEMARLAEKTSSWDNDKTNTVAELRFNGHQYQFFGNESIRQISLRFRIIALSILHRQKRLEFYGSEGAVDSHIDGTGNGKYHGYNAFS